MLAKVSNKDSHSVIRALIKQSRKLPKELYRSLTWDRGSEMAGHKTGPVALSCRPKFSFKPLSFRK
jgi:IS30 family transposase